MKRLSLIIVGLLFVVPLFAKDAAKRELPVGYVPPPELLYPITGEVILADNDTLKFKWSPQGFSDKDYYDFRLYKGYKMTEAAIILKERLDPDMYQYNVDSDRFDNEEVYTWALSQVYSDRKSDFRAIFFKVIKIKP